MSNRRFSNAFLMSTALLVFASDITPIVASKRFLDNPEQERAFKKSRSSSNSNASRSDIFPGIKHFKEDAEIIKEYLTNAPSTELHFFWTAGRGEPQDNNDTPVRVGGAQYDEKFPIYMEALLNCSPAHLKIKFICDALTQTSNDEWIKSLQAQYDDRFECLPITRIKENLLKTFPKQDKAIESVFKNASAGNPAIPSDIYRLIGMVYGRDLTLEEACQTQYIYCDIDTFCAGMDSPNEKMESYYDFESRSFKEKLERVDGHTNLIKTLFGRTPLKKVEPVQPSLLAERTFDPTSTFCMRRRIEASSGTNDIIKLSITDLQSYKGFCNTALFEMNDLNTKTKNSLNNLSIITYFPDLYSSIRACERDAEAEFKGYLDKFSTSCFDFKTIIDVTGPGLTKKLQFLPLDQSYPKTCAWGWHGTQLIEYGDRTVNLVHVEEEHELMAQSENEFSLYANRLSDAFFAKKFGADHPFNVKMIEYLRTHFPYKTPTFKTLLQKAYAYEKKEGVHAASEESWLASILGRITKRTRGQDMPITVDDPYYIRLTHLLDQLGIQISLTCDEIDFRK
ncbi:MAG: hypothetical protein ACTHJ4_08470 [Candidatus Nucleicultricaceae bacterium]